ncbi:MAG: hypothetical protein ACYDAX_09205 [Desulfobacteria bacterium]
MRKGFLIMVAVVLAAALAAPAMADTSLNGFIRTNGWMSNFAANGAGYIQPGKDLPSNSYVEERGRFLMKTGNENVKAVYFAEFDQAFGDSAYTTGRNMGGGLEADTTNLETKNIYVWFKVPNTSADFTVGVQNQSDSYAGVLFGYTDLAGVFANFKVDPVSVRLGWAKFWENKIAKADDVDFYVAEAKFSPTKDVKIGANLYFLNDMGGGAKGPTSAPGADPGLYGRGAVGAVNPAEFAGVTALRKVRVYIPGVDFSANVGPATLSGFAFYEFGKAEGTDNSVDIKGYVGDLRADANLGPGKAFLEAIYVSGDDNKTDRDYKGVITAGNYQLAGAFYCRTNMMILLPNPDDINTSYGLTYDTANGGAGIFHVAGGYSMKLMDKLVGAANVGYIAAAKNRARDQGSVYNFAKEKTMGTEINANVNYNITKGLDVGLYAGYAWLGSAYDTNAAGTATQDNDNLWTSKLRLNYAF